MGLGYSPWEWQLFFQARVWDIFANTHKPLPLPPPIEQPPQTGVAKLWAVKTEDFSPTSPSGLQVFFFEALCGLGVRTNNTKVLHLFRGLQGPSTQ